MKMRSTAPMRLAKIGYIVMSLAFCAVGILFIVMPEISALVLGRALGIAMIIFGIIKLIGYFSRDLYRLAFQYDLQFGILLIALGLIIVIKTVNVMDFIFIALGIAVLSDGLFKIQIALDSRKFGIPTWWITLTLAILTGAIGLMLVIRPWDSIRLLTVLLGISLLSEGILNLCVAISMVKIIRHQQPDIIDIEYHEVEENYRS